VLTFRTYQTGTKLKQAAERKLAEKKDTYVCCACVMLSCDKLCAVCADAHCSGSSAPMSVADILARRIAIIGDDKDDSDDEGDDWDDDDVSDVVCDVT
jgi:hypothetical protein